jgi:glycosyltransferase involved in cell wall biosynthesis
MKILYIAKQTLNHGAPRVHVLTVCEEFVRQGHNVILLTYAPVDNFGEIKFRIIELPKRVYKLSIKKGSIVWKVLVNLVVFFYNPDLIYERYTSNQIVNPIGKKAKHVVEINGWPPDYRSERWNRLYRTKWEDEFKENLSKVPLIITSSFGWAEKTRNLIDGENSKVVFIPNGVKMPDKKNQIYHLDIRDRIKVGYIGGFAALQDVETLIRSIKILHNNGQDIFLHLFGEGDLRSSSEELCEDLGISELVKFYGWIPNQDLYKISSNFDIAVAPYQRVCVERTNGMDAAMKLFDYWVHRKPVIITDLPTSQTYQQHHLKRYYAVPPESPQALAEAILYLAENPNLINQMVENGYRYVLENHTWEAIVSRIITTIEDELF